jgi:Tol biopolymer transport system component
MTLEPKDTLAHYRLVEVLGEGGMGVVWKAEDTKLGRSVAVKVLPAEFAADKQRLARFEREAKLLAALNHPNVAGIYGLEAVDGVHFLVLELVDGQTLARMTKTGPLPVEEALDVCRQVAEGLEAAHAAGVIHRDLKPGNVIVTEDGKAKVLDFGLAKEIEGAASGESASDLSMSPTVTVGGTQAGVVLGTAPYMSPEQARGKSLDKRTDIWSFGCLLYECLTGNPVFTGETVTDTLSTILQNDPDWHALPDRLPRRICDLLERCLEKGPRNRLHDISDARIDIERCLAAKEWTTAGARTASDGPSRSRFTAAAFGALGLVAGVAVTLLVTEYLGKGPAVPPLRMFSLSSTVSEHVAPARISPDGRRIAYRSGGRLWLRDLDQLEPREIAPSEAGWPLDWSPDGEWLVLADSREIFKIQVDGGSRTVLARQGFISPPVAGAAWQPDGTITFCTGPTGLLDVPAGGGEVVTRLKPGEGEGDFHNVNGLPGDRGLIYVIHRDVGMDTLGLLSEGERRTLLQLPGKNLWTPVYSPTGHILFAVGRFFGSELWALPFSLNRLEATGAPFLVDEDGTAPSVSADGTLVYSRVRPTGETRLVRVDRDGQEVRILGEPGIGHRSPAFSPDGKRVAFSIEEDGNRDIWILDITTASRQRLTFEPAPEDIPAWSPSGDRVAFNTDLLGLSEIFIKRTDGTGNTRPVTNGLFPAFSPDGRSLVFGVFEGDLSADIFRLDLESEPEPELFLSESFWDLSPQFSPDGRYLAHNSSSGTLEVYLRTFPGGEGKWQVSGPGGRYPRWNAKGDRLYYSHGSDLMEVEIQFDPIVNVGTPRKLFSWVAPVRRYYWPAPLFDVAPDGESFVIVKATKPDAPWQAIVVVESWSSQFAQSK